MAKTFDNISEASDTNYLFLFAQRTLALQNELPTPPPLNALGLPCHALCLLRDLLQKKDGTQKTDGTASEATATEAIGFEKARPSPFEREAMLEERAAAREAAAEGTQSSSTKEKKFAEKIQPLAELVTEYILNHQDDAAQEDRWRTTMKRDICKSFRIQDKKIDKQGIEMKERFDDAHAKMDETIQLVKDLAKQHHFSGD
jgi:histone H3/H4